MLIALILLTGCSANTFSRTYPNHSSDEVWQAMLIAAETPDYDDMDPAMRWSVVRNEIWISPDEARLEIYRELERTIIKPLREPRTENRTWRLKLAIAAEEPLRVYVTSNNWSIPMHLLEEADRYFRTMEAYLTPPGDRARMVGVDAIMDDDAADAQPDDAGDNESDDVVPPVDLIDDQSR